MPHPPPPNLQVEYLHDRVEVKLPRRRPLVRLALLVGLASALGAAAGAGLVELGVPVALTLVALIAAFLFSYGRPGTESFTVTDRYVELADQQILLSELDRHSVSGPDEDPYFLITGAYDEQRIVVAHRARSTLDYLSLLVDEAVEAHQRRVATEGKEYGIDRVAPEEIAQLRAERQGQE